MFGLNDGMRYYVCQRYVRMNLAQRSAIIAPKPSHCFPLIISEK